MDSHPVSSLPDSNSPTLHLTHPTAAERRKIWITTASTWDNTPDELLPLCLQRFEYLTTIPLAKNGGMTMWILTDSQYPPEHRPLLASCDTFRKRALFTRSGDGQLGGQGEAEGEGDAVANGIVHGIASVFTPFLYRRHGFAARLVRELAGLLPSWQTTTTLSSSSSSASFVPCIGSILYSDIGRTYYARLGWEVSGTNTEYIFKTALAPAQPHNVKPIAKSQLAELCSTDESMIRKAMSAFAHASASTAAPGVAAASEADRNRNRHRQRQVVAIIPDLDHMLWHMAKDEFTAELYLGGIPLVKGAVVGCPGERVWVVWTHTYYSHPLAEGLVGGENGLYILRLVVEEEEYTATATTTTTTTPTGAAAAERSDRLVQSVRAVLQAAQCEAREWRLDYVNLWEPSEFVRGLVERCGIEYEVSQRAEARIACGMWYGEDGGVLSETPIWIYNERYAYC
ncbi:hypothetical protein Aspvir_006087 [Aspergillus viridinutans]|uniref:LYC1 C-terminal domain-containing protein n=1 Tax=Aspergillus viridinutans TaxID=75553 RepID=A0A9P3BTL9_ASPVI|nr:uncharacterized protein Aspvir_006087 [Aspergillus viridinutans]GIK02044.1 hypothetical protein Aspvir_006087 [Aspergillus viridinutans]